MWAIEEIINSKEKPKKKVAILAERIKRDKKLVAQLVEFFKSGSDSERGTCMEAIEYVTKEAPEFGETCLDFVIEHISDKAPRVKWEACRVIGNVAHKFPDKVKEVIPKLLENTKDKGTVIRWGAAFALTEIAKSNSELQKQLIPEFHKILKREASTGVKKIYLRCLKGEP
ncbi:MAG: HEAT repeat domain-containing protein [Candidatus Thermoplasmatota archaeon]